jgi:hypothetical protein
LMDPVVERKGGGLQNRDTWVRLPPGSLEFRTWTSRSGRVVRIHENAGSNPAVLIVCPVAQWWCNPLLTGGLQVRVLPGQLIYRDVLLGEQSSSNLDAEGSTPSVLAGCPWPRHPRHRPAASERAGATPAGHSFRPVTQRVWRPVCQAGETGSSPVQGADIVS